MTSRHICCSRHLQQICDSFDGLNWWIMIQNILSPYSASWLLFLNGIRGGYIFHSSPFFGPLWNSSHTTTHKHTTRFITRHTLFSRRTYHLDLNSLNIMANSSASYKRSGVTSEKLLSTPWTILNIGLAVNFDMLAWHPNSSKQARHRPQ